MLSSSEEYLDVNSNGSGAEKLTGEARSRFHDLADSSKYNRLCLAYCELDKFSPQCPRSERIREGRHDFPQTFLILISHLTGTASKNIQIHNFPSPRRAACSQDANHVVFEKQSTATVTQARSTLFSHRDGIRMFRPKACSPDGDSPGTIDDSPDDTR